jgi:surface polysaccharide O-acyltransferase-like enzyme
MWYLYLILIIYALTPFIKWLLGKVPKAFVYGIMAILVLGVSVIPFFEALNGVGKIYAFPKQGIYVFYYLCGYAFSVREKRPTKKEGIYCLIGFFAILILETVSRFVEGYAIEMAYGYPLTLLAAILLFDAGWTFQQLAGEENKTKDLFRSKLLSVCAWMSPLCFGIYLIHPAFLNLFYKILKISINDFRFYVGVPLFFGIAFFGALICAWILRLIPPMRKYIL